MTETFSTPTLPRPPKRSKALRNVGLIIFFLLLGWVIWDNWPREVDAVTETTRKTATVEELRAALNKLEPPKGIAILYHQAVGEKCVGFSCQVLPTGWPGQTIDISTLSADQLAAPLSNVLALAKASTWEWDSVEFDCYYPRNGSSITALHATYSRSTLDHINLSKVHGQALLSAADRHTLDPQFKWTGK